MAAYTERGLAFITEPRVIGRPSSTSRLRASTLAARRRLPTTTALRHEARSHHTGEPPVATGDVHLRLIFAAGMTRCCPPLRLQPGVQVCNGVCRPTSTPTNALTEPATVIPWPKVRKGIPIPYFRTWLKAGFFLALWQAGLAEYDEMEGIAWRWQSVDGSLLKAPLARESVGPNPTDRGKKWKQAAPPGRRAWGPAVDLRHRSQSARRDPA